jgi:hypothetical protein
LGILRALKTLLSALLELSRMLQNSSPIHRRLLSCGGWNPEEGGNYAKKEATMAKRNKQLSGQPSVIPFNRRRTPMPVDFRQVGVSIPSGTGHRILTSSVFFGSTVNRANVALNGFKLDFTAGGDRHINEVEIDTNISSFSGSLVTFDVHCQYADVNFDDPYGGFIQVLVIADVQ